MPTPPLEMHTLLLWQPMETEMPPQEHKDSNCSSTLDYQLDPFLSPLVFPLLPLLPLPPLEPLPLLPLPPLEQPPPLPLPPLPLLPPPPLPVCLLLFCLFCFMLLFCCFVVTYCVSCSPWYLRFFFRPSQHCFGCYVGPPFVSYKYKIKNKIWVTWAEYFFFFLHNRIFLKNIVVEISLQLVDIPLHLSILSTLATSLLFSLSFSFPFLAT